jgi:hypothetical protein
MTFTKLLFQRIGTLEAGAMLAVLLLAGSAFVSPLQAQSTPTPDNAATTGNTAAAAHASNHYKPNRFSHRATAYYNVYWGIDLLSVKAVESGELIRFSYRVLDADKAKALNEKTTEPSLIAPDARIRLSIPSLEKVGKLRQSSTPEVGKSYWMAFSNPGRKVKPGDRVDVVIGQFRATGLIVE